MSRSFPWAKPFEVNVQKLHREPGRHQRYVDTFSGDMFSVVQSPEPELRSSLALTMVKLFVQAGGLNNPTRG